MATPYVPIMLNQPQQPQPVMLTRPNNINWNDMQQYSPILDQSYSNTLATINTGSPQAIAASVPNAKPADTGSNWFNRESAFGTKDSTGWFTGGAQALSGLASAWAGMEQVGIARDQLSLARDAYNTNLANQRTAYNTAVEDSYQRKVNALGADAAQERFGTLAEYQARRNV